jgi:Domain of unknown function (DUF4386)
MNIHTTHSPAHKRSVSRAIGLLFILPFLAYGGGSTLIAPVMQGSAADLMAHSGQLTLGALLLLLNSIVVIAIGVMSFGVLQQHNGTVAVAYLATRFAEGIVLVVGIVAMLLPTALPQGKAQGDAQEIFRLIALKANFWAYTFAMMFLGLGSMPFCFVLLRGKLIPAGLAWLGIAGYALLFIGSLMDCFGFSVGLVLSLPGGLFELGIGLWLILKGFVRWKKITPSPRPSVS